MFLQAQVKKAIGSHGLWKRRLKDAIQTGSSDFTVADVAADDRCEFGKWLYSLDDPALATDVHYQTIRGLHAEFHKEVATILKQALAGKREQALRAMEAGSPYSNCSDALTAELITWGKTDA